MTPVLVKEIRELPAVRDSFFQLARQVFELSFEPWYRQGFWTQRYIPYCLVDPEKNWVLANASVNRIMTQWQGQRLQFIQIGTVMTRPEYRGLGYSRNLLEEILRDWGSSDCVYLYANDSVLDFYPKFGFHRAQEFTFRTQVTPIPGDFTRLDMDAPGARELLRQCYEHSNPYSELPMLDNWGLLMFYCAEFLKDCVYYSARRRAVCIAQRQGDTLHCYDCFGQPDCTLLTLLGELAPDGISCAQLGFTPRDASPFTCLPADEEDTTLFVYGQAPSIFETHPVQMPVLSHA